MTRNSSEKGQTHPVVEVIGAEELYRRYLRIRAERDNARKESDLSLTEVKKEVKKASRGDILS